MLTAETFRFKDSATVKMHKLGNVRRVFNFGQLF
jgi:hypothetical protein